MESAKEAMRDTRPSVPIGHLLNLSSSLWEFAYWWGGVAALNQKTATDDESSTKS
jgi:hypothetical protein